MRFALAIFLPPRSAIHWGELASLRTVSSLQSSRLSLKEIGDHLGHRSTSATSIYAKVNMSALREVGAFDLGDVQ